jgi:alkyl hydroperoxide reductase subunit AhpF
VSRLFDEETIAELRRFFRALRKNLKDIVVLDSIINPGGSGKCGTCLEAKLLVEELMKISGSKVSFEVLELTSAGPLKPRYIPAFIYDTARRNVRYYGLPSGQEFAPFIYVHEYISEGVKLSKHVVEEVEAIEVPLHVRIFVTPECPYCPIVVDFMNQVGIVNSNILVETIEAFEHPYEADKYRVLYVPYIAVTRIEEYEVYGAKPVEVVPGYIPPEELLEVLKRAEKKLKKST